MHLELYASDSEFLIKLLDKTHLMRLIETIRQANTHPEHKDFILWELDQSDAQELLGQLAFEANHCRSKSKAMRINDIADQVENQI
jgi:hypothetical protein